MGTLALDIETASPFAEPAGDNSTEYYEWLSVAVAYHEPGETNPDVAVLFRRGGWDDEHTADLLDRLLAWCEGRDIERTLTYNGAWFDLRHMANWAEALGAAGVRPNALSELTAALSRHVDVAKAAADRHREELWDDQVILPDWKAYQLEGIDNDRIWYDDYDFDPAYQLEGIDDAFVKGEHVGRVLGERYVEGVVAGLEETHTHRELKRLLTDYSRSDITDLCALYESLGGETLDETHTYPLAEIDR